MKFSASLRLTLLAAAGALLATAAQAGPMPIQAAAMKSVVDHDTTQVRWGVYGGYRGGYGYRRGLISRGGYGYGGYGYPGSGYRRFGYGVAGAVVGGAIARSAYYGAYGSPYGNGYYGGYPDYNSPPPVSYYGYGSGYGYGGGVYCPPYGGYAGY